MDLPRSFSQGGEGDGENGGSIKITSMLKPAGTEERVGTLFLFMVHTTLETGVLTQCNLFLYLKEGIPSVPVFPSFIYITH